MYFFTAPRPVKVSQTARNTTISLHHSQQYTLSLTMTGILNLHKTAAHGLSPKTKTRDEIKHSLRSSKSSLIFQTWNQNKADANTQNLPRPSSSQTADAMWRHTLQSPPNKLRLQLKIKASHRDPERTNSFIRGKKRPCSKKSSALPVFWGTRTHTYTHGISKLAVESNWVTVEFGLTEGRLAEHEIRALYSSLAGERRLTETERKGVRVCVCVCYLWQVREGKAERLEGGRSQHSGCSVRWKGEERLQVNMRERPTRCDLCEQP